MSAIEYPDLSSPDPETAELIERIGKGRPFLPNPYRMLLWSPGLTEAWLGLANAVRFESRLDDRSREMAILLVAHIAGCEYEWRHHESIGRAAGITDDELERIRRFPSLQGWNRSDASLLSVAGAVAEGRAIPGESLTELRSRIDEQGVVELAASVSYYLGLAKFLLAFEIEFEGSSA